MRIKTQESIEENIEENFEEPLMHRPRPFAIICGLFLIRSLKA